METAIKQLRKGSNNSQVYKTLVFLRTTYFRDRKEENLVKFREFGGLQALIYLIQRPHHKIVDLALSILGNCCLESESRKLVSRLQGVQHVVKILECLEKESLLNRACRTLANMALDDQIADEIMKSQAVHFIIQLLKSETTTDTNLKQAAIRMLRILSSNAKHRKEIVSRDAVRIIAKILLSEEDEKDEELIYCILMAIVTMSNECTIDCAEQLQSDGFLEKLVKFSTSENRVIQDGSLHVLANASTQASLRHRLGVVGVFTSLVTRIEKWEKSSNGWQWAVDAFCQCTREMNNHFRVSKSGGLKHLVTLLQEPIEERLWLCSLSSISSFLFNTECFSVLADLGMITALVDKLSLLIAKEKPSEHKILNISRDVPIEIGNEIEPALKRFCDDQNFVNDHRRLSQSSPHTYCFSPDSSPPYWTSFPSSSSPNSQFPRMSPCSFSPCRNTSPLPLQPTVELCYSPVYESGESDDDREEAKSKDSCNQDVTDGSGETSSPASVESDHHHHRHHQQEDVEVNGSSESGSGRSPIGDILLLLSRLSFVDKQHPCFVTVRTLTVLIDYIVTVDLPQLRAKKILSRIARNALSFERLVVLRIPELIRQRLVLMPHDTNECSACETVAVYGHSLMSDLRFQAESPFGSGVIHHLILAGRNQEEKLSALLAAVYLVRSSKIQQQLLLDTDGLTVLTCVVGDAEHSDYDAVVRGVVHLAQTLCLNTDPISNEPLEPPMRCDVSCLYEGSVKGDDGDNIVRLTVRDSDEHILAHRNVLARGCDVFNAMLCGSFAESQLETVSMEDTSFEALEYVIHCLYSCHSDSCSVLRADGLNVAARLLSALALADKLLLPDVKDGIASRLINYRTQLTDAECVDAFVSSKIYDCPRLSSWIVRDTLTTKRFVDDNIRIRRVRELATNCKQFTVDAWQLIAYGISTIT